MPVPARFSLGRSAVTSATGGYGLGMDPKPVAKRIDLGARLNKPLLKRNVKLCRYSVDMRKGYAVIIDCKILGKAAM